MGERIAIIAAAFGAGLVVTLVLAAHLTPRQWWRRANARAAGVLAAGTVAIGGALAWAFAPAQPALASQPLPDLAADAPARVSQPVAGASYRVYRDLNLRAAGGVASRRVAVVPAGANVTATGRRAGDWWQVHARAGGKTLRGWASSLWLRRVDERGATGQAPSD